MGCTHSLVDVSTSHQGEHQIFGWILRVNGERSILDSTSELEQSRERWGDGGRGGESPSGRWGLNFCEKVKWVPFVQILVHDSAPLAGREEAVEEMEHDSDNVSFLLTPEKRHCYSERQKSESQGSDVTLPYCQGGSSPVRASPVAADLTNDDRQVIKQSCHLFTSLEFSGVVRGQTSWVKCLFWQIFSRSFWFPDWKVLVGSSCLWVSSLQAIGHSICNTPESMDLGSSDSVVPEARKFTLRKTPSTRMRLAL